MLALTGIIGLTITECVHAVDPPFDDFYLIVLDIQAYDFKDPALNNAVTELAHTVNTMLETFDPDKIIYIKSAGQMLSISLRGIKVDTLLPPDLHPDLHLVNEILFTKTGGDAFSAEGLHPFLEKHNARKIAIVGLMAGECVYDTALGGLEKGYDMYLLTDAILGKSEKKKMKALRKMTYEGVKVL